MLRVKVVLSLKKDQIEHTKDEKTSKMVYAIKVFQKRKYMTVAIPDELALKLLNASTNDKVFNVSIHTLNLTFSKYKEKYEIAPERNIVLHSLKKAGTDYVYYNSGKDIVATAKATHHSSIQTTFKHYAGKNESLTDQLSYSLHTDKVSVNTLKGLTKMELLVLISKAGDATIRQLINLMEKEYK
jgi:integrase